MTIEKRTLTDACHTLGIDPKTLKRWLAKAMVTPQTDQYDQRRKWITQKDFEKVQAMIANVPISPRANQQFHIEMLRTQMEKLEDRITELETWQMRYIKL